MIPLFSWGLGIGRTSPPSDKILYKVLVLRINIQKSHLLLLGCHLHPPLSLEGIQIVDKAKILGVYFMNEIKEDEQYALNYQTPLTKISHTCQPYAHSL